MKPTIKLPTLCGFSIVIIVLTILMTGCTSAPVQEMSDARQAVEAASRAGAVNAAPKQMNAAKAALVMAERLLRDHQFSAARHYARIAKSRAVEAQQLTEPSVPPAQSSEH